MVNMDTGRTAGFRGEILPLGCPSPRTLLSSLPSCGPWFSFVWSLMLEIPQTTLHSILPTFQIQAQTILLKKTFPNSLYLTVCARYTRIMGFPGSSASKESTCHVGDLGLRPGFDPWVGKIPGEGKGYLLQYSVREFHGLYSPWVAKSQTQLSDFHLTFIHSIGLPRWR